MATKIICRASDCIFWEDKLCTSEEITYDPEEGCLTYEVLDDVIDLDAEEEEWYSCHRARPSQPAERATGHAAQGNSQF